MMIIELGKEILVTILVTYLTFTNTLAEKIESLLPHKEAEIDTSSTAAHTPNILPYTEKSSTISDRLIPQILRENSKFQRAAAIASTRDEGVVTIPEDIEITEAIKDALVNIYCQYTTERFIRTTTGTGFFVHQKGVILTNAHVAQFLLLENSNTIDGDIECVIREGNPATAKYTAELLYISPAWILDNAKLITEEAPRGTGERDYALLYISKTTDGTPLPSKFPAIPIDVALLTRSIAGATVVTGGYPAGILIREGADAALAPIVSPAKIATLYTFGSNYADIFSISESPVGEQGASGGPVVNEIDREAIGLIVTKGDEEIEGTHSLRAITLSYVDRTIVEETGFTLRENMQGDVAFRGNVFNEAIAPLLREVLAEELTETN